MDRSETKLVGTERRAQAIVIAEPSLTDQERLWNSNCPGSLKTRNNLASAYRDAGRTAEAIALHERNLADQERVLGSDHPDTLKTQSNLGSAYRDA